MAHFMRIFGGTFNSCVPTGQSVNVYQRFSGQLDGWLDEAERFESLSADNTRGPTTLLQNGGFGPSGQLYDTDTDQDGSNVSTTSTLRRCYRMGVSS